MRKGRRVDPVVVGVSLPEVLLAERADILAGEFNGDSQWYNLATGAYSGIIPHQVWYKWTCWDPVVPGAEPPQFGEPRDFIDRFRAAEPPVAERPHSFHSLPTPLPFPTN